MNDEGCFQDGVAGGTFDNITAGIGGGTALTAATPGSAAASIGGATGLDITVQAFPPADGQSAFTLASANYAWAINAKSDDAVKASAQDFLDWVAQPEQAQAYADLAGYVPITGVDAADPRRRATRRSATCSRPAPTPACPTRAGRTRPSTTPSASASRAC